MISKKLTSLFMPVQISLAPAYAADEWKEPVPGPMEIAQRLDRLESVLPPQARELAELLGLKDDFRRLSVLKEKSEHSSGATIDDLKVEVELSRLRSKLTRRILRASLEIDYVMSAIEHECGRDMYFLAMLSSSLSKRLLWANRLDAIANAVLWSATGIIAIPAYKHSRLSIPSGTMNIVAGTVPSSLELGALELRKKMKYSDSRFETPNMLGPIFGVTGGATAPVTKAEDHYPFHVWKYLNAIPARSKQSRIEFMIENWTESGFMSSPGTAEFRKQLPLLTGTERGNLKLSQKIIANRIIMLNYVRVTVYNMKKGLFELMELIQ